MNWLKIYLIVVTVLLFLSLSASVYVWYTYQNNIPDELPTLPQNESVEKVEKTISELKPAPTDTPKDQTQPKESIQPSTPKEPVVIKTDTLSDTQKKLLSVFGFDEETYVITSKMIQCAEEAVGKPRLDEITNGSAPSPFEAAKLMPCFKNAP